MADLQARSVSLSPQRGDSSNIALSCGGPFYHRTGPRIINTVIQSAIQTVQKPNITSELAETAEIAAQGELSAPHS
jgi:hypothetical protein